MNTRKTILLGIAALAAAAALARPTRGIVSAVGARFSEVVDNEFWRWPTELAEAIQTNPSTVWNPEVGKWYNRISSNGYSRRGDPTGEFGEGFVHCKTDTGYSYGCFLDLPSGDYVLTGKFDNNSRVYITAYSRSGDGWKYSGNIAWQRAYNLSLQFTVPEDCLPLILVYPNEGTWATLTEVSIKRD